MQPAKYETTSVKIGADDYRFTVSASKIIFEGFRLAYVESDEEKQSGNVMVNSIDKDSELTKESFDYKQHFTQPPAHYTEASLVKTLEELGIGRPSTYAPTISTIITRRYVAKENKNLYMTELGEVVNNIMKQSFASIVDVNFTAYMEGLLDMIAEGKVEWKSVISNFYPDLKEAVEKAEKELETVKIEDEVTDVVCEECGRNMVIKYGPMESSLHVPDSRNAATPNRIWRKSELPARNVEKTLYCARQRKADVIMDVRIIRNVILCHGRSRQKKNARNAEVIW